ncbi:MAG TPA: cupin domain-containing protein [Steroidobacteraceae bacterium]|jgi:mannose-6-phosphate isomerase-like protein (cupin superfamily)|nr:cupin domain-containing protein [Steroidobacteraceae bacterium]
MNVTPNPVLTQSPFPGILHATLAGSAQGLKRLSIWEQVLKSGSSTPPHSHDCEEVVMCLGGRGDLLFGDGRRLRFGVNQTLTIPPNQVHQILNAGPEALHVVAVFSQSPVRVKKPDGDAVDMSWAT